jgi:hypothetical protein
MSGPTRYSRNQRDTNERVLLDLALQLGGHWIEAPPLDGYIWVPRMNMLRPVEIKLPEREGAAREFTPLQRRFRSRCELIGLPILIWRSAADVLRDLNGG